jgi:CBS domain containing-hemolysin-like protein
MAKQVFENDNWFGVYISSLVLAVILFGEIIPKNFGENFSLRYSLFIAPLVKFWIWILGPIVGILDRLITKIFPNDKTAFSTSKEEIRIMVQMGEKENSIRKGESELIHNVFKMNDKIAKNIMTPRVNIEALDINLTFKEQELDIFDASHSRLPIYSQDCDDIRGFVLMREILEAMASGKTDQKPDDYLYDILVINEYIKVDVLLMLFKKKRTHIALVKDEFGGTAGIVTLEDVLEELVGEIIDETDEQEDMRSNKNLVCG